MMMRISPIDIQQHQFKSRPFGYEKAGVDQFLELLADELERLIRKNQDLHEELSRTNATLTEMRDREETLKETLVTTQKITEELKSTARREVDVLMAEAEVKAERLMHTAEERRLQLLDEVQEIKRQKIDFEVGLRGLLEKHIRMLDLNAVAIEQQDAESRLLGEHLPYINPPDENQAEHASQPVDPVAVSDEDSELIESEQIEAEPEASPDSVAGSESPFYFDPDEEDLLK